LLDQLFDELLDPPAQPLLYRVKPSFAVKS
jgi:hypothetical protein